MTQSLALMVFAILYVGLLAAGVFQSRRTQRKTSSNFNDPEIDKRIIVASYINSRRIRWSTETGYLPAADCFSSPINCGRVDLNPPVSEG